MYPFLKAIARAYGRRYEDLSEFCFVFPNKRSGTFFLKYLKAEMKKTVIAPEILTITEFVSRVGNCVVDNRISTLFTLYDCYTRFLPSGVKPDFDSFRTWGETALSDFNEVGMNCSDSDMFFKNLRDHKEIATDFLTDDQKKIMEEYFGVSFTEKADRAFWAHFNKPGNPSSTEENPVYSGNDNAFSEEEDGRIPIRGRFLKLWEMLAPLYDALTNRLAEKGLVTSAGAYNQAMTRLREEGREIIPWKKVVFIGFNALTFIELEIFKKMKSFGAMSCGPHPDDSLADFYWDAAGPVFKRLSEEKYSRANSAARFVTANRNRFPEPEWSRESMRLSDTDSLPTKLRAVSAPSNSIQAKIAAEEVGRIYSEGELKKLQNARVAVVLPDENLLLPFLYALPNEFKDINLTMGYPLRQTSIVTFIGHLRQTLRTSRLSENRTLYYMQDLRLLLSHPLSQILSGHGVIDSFIAKAEKDHRMFVSDSELRDAIPGLSVIFSPPLSNDMPLTVTDWLEKVLNGISDAICVGNDAFVKSGLDSEHIRAYIEGLNPLRAVLKTSGVKMSRDTVLSLAQRLAGNGRVNLEGEPLKGLQVMGLLETRSLDFDKVIIPSLNERIVPMRSRSRTFIPNVLRTAYGLPPANYAENLFAYYFYRLISRAKEVVMIYDGRSGSGLRSGGASRYIYQLRHLFAEGRLVDQERTFDLIDLIPFIEPIKKSPEIMECLDKYLVSDSAGDPKEGSCLSATAVNDYCLCQKKFFFKHIAKIPEHAEVSPHVDHVQLGNIVHRVMENIYKNVPLKVDIRFIDNLLKEDNIEIYRLSTMSMLEELPFLKKQPGFPADYEIVRDTVVRMVRGILRADRDVCMNQPGGSFEVLGTEKKGVEVLETKKGRKYRFSYAIDRVDKSGGRLKIVDYKTGMTHALGKSFEEMFDANSKGMTNFLQLMAYAGIARRLWPDLCRDGVEMVLYRVTEMARDNIGKEDYRFVRPGFKDVNRETKKNFTEIFLTDTSIKRVEDRVTTIINGTEYRDEFDERLAEKIDTLYDSPEFVPSENPGLCSYCPYSRYCLK